MSLSNHIIKKSFPQPSANNSLNLRIVYGRCLRMDKWSNRRNPADDCAGLNQKFSVQISSSITRYFSCSRAAPAVVK